MSQVALDLNEQASETAELQNPRMATQKSTGSILSLSLISQSRAVWHQEEFSSVEFFPWRAEEPQWALPLCISYIGRWLLYHGTSVTELKEMEIWELSEKEFKMIKEAQIIQEDR